HVLDAATGMNYMQQRYYDPAIGRFLSVDPVTANSGTGANFNRYWYANNNPYRFTDPDGRQTCDSACGADENEVRDGGNGNFFVGIFKAFRDGFAPIAHGIVDPYGTNISTDYDRIGPGPGHVEQGGYKFGSALMVAEGARGFGQVSGGAVSNLAVSSSRARSLYHYTSDAGMRGILESNQLLPSLRSLNPNDVRYGNGQYLSNIVPGTRTSAQLSRDFLGQPFQGRRYTNYVEINVTGLNVVEGRSGVFVVPNDDPLDVVGRIISSGKNSP
ncbi:HYD1 signature containing ADP-ribosyltransferase family protein, partial [Luteimonas aquatica]|uniref:HYD1 signature containing ADP-ribosyltransferase family protein n=1 Tax=Luteimonas aquatica TaxID=450364 RepID=UPI0024125B57